MLLLLRWRQTPQCSHHVHPLFPSILPSLPPLLQRELSQGGLYGGGDAVVESRRCQLEDVLPDQHVRMLQGERKEGREEGKEG